MFVIFFSSFFFSYEVIYSILTSANRNESKASLLTIAKLHRYDKYFQRKNCHSALDFLILFTFKCHCFRYEVEGQNNYGTYGGTREKSDDASDDANGIIGVLGAKQMQLYCSSSWY